MKIVGVFSSGKTSQTVQAILKLGDTDKVIVVSSEGAELMISASISDLEISSRLGNTPRRLEFINGEAFSTDDNDAIDKLISTREDTGFSSIVHKFESHLGLVIAATILIVIFIWASLAKGVPYFAREVAFQLPQSVQESFGAGSLDILDQLVFEPSSLEEEEISRLRSLLIPVLAQESNTPHLEFRSGIGANAFALPDGTVVLTDELVELADDDELLAVLYHEMGHLHHRHILRRTLQDSLITLGVVLITGDLESASILVGVPTLLLDLSYTREFELEADRFALESMLVAGIDLSKFEQVMKKLSDAIATDEFSPIEAATDSKLLDYLSTHPSTSDRVALIREYSL